MLDLDLRLHRQHVLAGMPDQRLFAMLQLRPQAAMQRVRAPISVVFVLDASGSMGAGRGELVLAGLRRVLGAGLLRPDDRVGLVRFADGAHMALPLTPRRQHLAIESGLGLLAGWGGATALGAGLERALRMLDGVQGGRRVVLLTDGEAQDPDQALRAAKALGAQHTPVTAIGVGDSWNVELLTRITGLTQGRPMHLVSDDTPAELPSVALASLPAVLEGELRHTLATAISETRLAVTLAPGVALERVSRVFPTVSEVAASPAGYALGPLAAGTTTTFVLELVLPTLAAGPFAVAELALDYVLAGEPGAAPPVGRLPPAALAATATPDAARAGKLDAVVMRAVQQRNLDALLEQAAALFAQDPARARELLELARDLTVRLGNDAMTLVVEQALGQVGPLPPGLAARMAVGSKTLTVNLAGLDGLPSAARIREITGV